MKHIAVPAQTLPYVQDWNIAFRLIVNVCLDLISRD